MAKYITSYGDRVAVLSFCQQTMCNLDKETILERLRNKIETRKIRSKTKRVKCGTSGVQQKLGEQMARHRNSAAEKTFRRIEIGWLNFFNNQYHQVRTNNGGGTRHATVEKTKTVAQILELGKELFFPDGHSTKGHVDDFTFEICDFKRKQIVLDDTVGRLYDQTKLKLLRFYICTKEERHECCEDSISKDSSVSITEGADSQLTEDGSHLDADHSITDLLYHDSDINEQVCSNRKNICYKVITSNN